MDIKLENQIWTVNKVGVNIKNNLMIKLYVNGNSKV